MESYIKLTIVLVLANIVSNFELNNNVYDPLNFSLKNLENSSRNSESIVMLN